MLFDPLLFAADGVGDLIAVNARAQMILVPDPGNQELRVEVVDITVFRIAQDQTVFGVEEGEGLRDGLDRIFELPA